MRKVLGLFIFVAVFLVVPLSAEERQRPARTNVDAVAVSEAPADCNTDKAASSPSEPASSTSFNGGRPFAIATTSWEDESNQAWLECRAVGGGIVSCAMIAAAVYYSCD